MPPPLAAGVVPLPPPPPNDRLWLWLWLVVRQQVSGSVLGVCGGELRIFKSRTLLMYVGEEVMSGPSVMGVSLKGDEGSSTMWLA